MENNPTIFDKSGLKTRVACECDQPMPFLKLGAPVDQPGDAQPGFIHPFPKGDDTDVMGIITKCFVARCPNCKATYMIDERYQLIGYEHRIDTGDGLYGETEYYTPEAFRE